MPNVTAPTRSMGDGDVVTQFVDSVSTTAVTYTYLKTQEKFKLRNTGEQSLSVTVAGITQTVVAGDKWETVADFAFFSINAVSGRTAFDAWADEKGFTFDNTVPSKNLFDKFKSTNGFIKAYTDGGYSVSATDYYSDYIPVIAGQILFLNRTFVHICYCDSNRRFVSGIVTGGTAVNFTIPVGVSYMVFSSSISNKDTAQLEVGTAGTTYAPFNYFYQNQTNDCNYFDVAYIYNRQLVANQNFSGSNAQYTGVDLGSGNVPTSMACKAIFRTSCTLGLISNPNGLLTVGNITLGSLHIVFTDTQVIVSVLDSTVQTVLLTQSYTSPCALDGKTIYSFSWSVSSNTLTLIVPGGTYTVTDARIPAHMGRYCTIEHYTTTQAQLFPIFTYFEVQGTNFTLKDNFKRQNGAIGNAPTGQSYVQVLLGNS